MIYQYLKYALNRDKVGLQLFSQFRQSWKFNSALFNDRRYFYELFRPYTGFELFTRDELQFKPFLLDYVYQKNFNQVFLKKAGYHDGEGIVKLNLDSIQPKMLLHYMRKNKLSYLEFPVQQDSVLSEMGPKGINTINILSYSNNEFIGEILAASLQLSLYTCLDSLGAGGIWVNLDPKLGHALGPGRQIFPKKQNHSRHPITGEIFENFELGFWNELLDTVRLIHSRLKLKGLYTFEMIIQDGKPRLLDLRGIESIPFWEELGNMSIASEILPS